MCLMATYDLPRALQEASRPAATPAMITGPNPAFSRRLTWQISYGCSRGHHRREKAMLRTISARSTRSHAAPGDLAAHTSSGASSMRAPTAPAKHVPAPMLHMCDTLLLQRIVHRFAGDMVQLVVSLGELPIMIGQLSALI